MSRTFLQIDPVTKRNVGKLVERATRRGATWSDIDLSDKDFPLTIFPPPNGGKMRRIIMNSKAYLTQKLIHRPSHIAIACKAGIWDPTSVQIVAALAEKTDLEIRFVGDLDATDLVIFLSATLMFARWGIPLHYGGINDHWIKTCERKFIRNDWAKEWESIVAIDIGKNERQMVQDIFKACPEIRGLLGPKSVAILLKGTKVELEGTWNAALYGPDFELSWSRLFYGARFQNKPPK